MTYDQGVADRIRQFFPAEEEVVEKTMFGGLAVLVNGNMACGVQGDELLVRSDPDHHAEYVIEPGARPFDLSGRPMRGWIVVEPSGFARDDDLRRWLARGFDHARSLPAK